MAMCYLPAFAHVIGSPSVVHKVQASREDFTLWRVLCSRAQCSRRHAGTPAAKSSDLLPVLQLVRRSRYTSSEGFNIFRRIQQSKCPLEHLWAVTTIIYACRCHDKTNEALLVSERLQNPQNLKVPPSLLVLPSSYSATTSFAYSIPFYYFFFY